VLTQEDIQRVTSGVRRILSTHHDPEQVALDILFVSWQNGVTYPSRRFIYQRCMEVLRRDQRERYHTQARARQPAPPPATPSPETTDMIAHLTTVLDPAEKRVIWYRFYWDLTLVEIADKLVTNQTWVQETLAIAIHKMKLEALGE
jgi:DNA-directed RNA polymerase specialized sigma24 family protein